MFVSGDKIKLAIHIIRVIEIFCFLLVLYLWNSYSHDVLNVIHVHRNSRVNGCYLFENAFFEIYVS